MNAEQRVLTWLERADFDGTGCRWSQQTIADAVGCNRRTVIRATQHLAEQGRITVEKERRPGCKWPCNVYRVKTWNPHKRSGVLNVLASIREARKAECHTEENSRFSRAQNAVARPTTRALTPRCFAVEGPTTVVARLEIRNRRTGMQPHGAQRRFAVPDLTCTTCQELAEELDRARGLLRSQAVEASKLAEDLSSAYQRDRVQGNEIAKLKRQITRTANEDAEAETIRELLEDWQHEHPKAQIPDGGRRWDVAKKALRLMRDDPAGPKAACLEALEGLRLRPYQLYEKRYSAPGEGRVLRNDVEHALGDENRIERCRAIARWHRMQPAERKWQFYLLAAAVSEAYFRQAVDELNAPKDTPDSSFEVDGIVVRDA